MISQEKLMFKKIFTKNKQETSKNEVKPLKRRYLNLVIVPNDADHFSETSEAQISNIGSKIPEIFQDFLSEESFSEIGKNILKYTNLFKSGFETYFYNNLFIKPSISQKYKNLS